MKNYYLAVLDLLSTIKRFPQVQIWFDHLKNLYYVECSPSFETVKGKGETLQLAIQDLVDKIESYLSTEEWNDLENLKDELGRSM